MPDRDGPWPWWYRTIWAALFALALLMAADPALGQQKSGLVDIGTVVGQEKEAACWRHPVCQSASHVALHAAGAWAMDAALGGLVEDREAAWISAGVGLVIETAHLIDYGTNDGGPYGDWDALVDVTVRVGGGFTVHVLP